MQDTYPILDRHEREQEAALQDWTQPVQVRITADACAVLLLDHAEAGLDARGRSWSSWLCDWRSFLVSPPCARCHWRPCYSCCAGNWAAGTEAALAKVLQKQQGVKPLALEKVDLGKDQIPKNPKLKAKAAQAKDLLDFVVGLAKEFKEDGSDIAANRCLAVEELAAMYALVRKHEVSADELMAWRVHAAMFAFHYASCGFKFYPKFHYLMHIPEQVEQGGVLRSFWVYAEESKNRQLKTLFNMCSKGASVHQQILLRMQWLHALLALE